MNPDLHLSSADRDDDFQLVTLGEHPFGILAARHDIAIFFQCDTFSGITERFNERRDAANIGYLACDAVYIDSNHFQFALQLR